MVAMLLLPVQRLAALAAHPRAPRLAAGDVVDVVLHTHRFIAARADDHHVRHRDGALALGDAALDLLGGVGAGVPLDHHHVLHQHLAGFAVDAEHAAGLALVAAA